MRRCSSLIRPTAQTRLKWPLEPDDRLSLHLHSVEEHWKNCVTYSPKPIKNPSKYVLAMFPYPSGRLHMGHLRVYSISDVCARYYALQGFSVIHPIGWDAFGLPAENAAFQHGVDAKVWTYDNINIMREQLKKTGISFDWDREIMTCESSFFKWTQWIFLQLHAAGLVRRALAEVFWDPVNKTVLAAEQVDANGLSWRSGAPAEKRKLRQWIVETPKFAKRMLDGLEALRYHWGEIADIQANWIGKCDVYRFMLPIKSCDEKFDEFLDLRLQNPLDLVSAQFVIVAADHPLANQSGTDCYLLKETVFNFVNGVEMPIVVLADKNNFAGIKCSFMGARLADPMHCIFDLDIAKKCALNIRKLPEQLINVEEIEKEAKKCNVGGYLTSRTLRDWVVSRQRGWGTPIPMILDSENCAAPVPFSDHQLPVRLEQLGQPIQCNKFASGRGIIENDTLDTFFDSSWYFLRYLDPHNDNELVNRNIANRQMPVDVYVGGVEHADVHLFFARFISHFLYDLGVLSDMEPFRRLIPQGIVRGQTFKLVGSDIYVSASDVTEDPKKSGTYKQKLTNLPVILNFEKMSKSKMNGVDPLRVIEVDGKDLARLQLLDAASPRQPINWGHTQKADVRGLKRFIDRCAAIINVYIDGRKRFSGAGEDNGCLATLDADIEEYCCNLRNECVRTVSVAVEIINVHNTAIERLQVLTSGLKKIDLRTAGRSIEFEKAVHSLVIMLQIFAPHVASELWTALAQVPKISPTLWDSEAPVIAQKWPQVDADALIDFIVWVNGKTLKCGERRPIIESLTLAELIDLAKTKYHVHFFNLLAEKQLDIAGFELEKRPGMFVTLKVNLREDVDECEISNILQTIRNEKLTILKSEKNKKNRIRFVLDISLLKTYAMLQTMKKS